MVDDLAVVVDGRHIDGDRGGLLTELGAASRELDAVTVLDVPDSVLELGANHLDRGLVKRIDLHLETILPIPLQMYSTLNYLSC